MRSFFLLASVATFAIGTLHSQHAAAQEDESATRLDVRIGGTDHRPTGNDRWGALLRATVAFELGDEAEIVIEGAASIAGRVAETEAGPFGLGVHGLFGRATDTTRRTSRIGMHGAFPVDDSNVAFVALYAFGIAEPWLLGPGYVSFMGGGRFEERLARVLHFALDGTGALMVAPGYGSVILTGVGAFEAGFVLGPVSLVGRLSAAFAGLIWAVAGQPRVRIDFGDVWIEAGASATFAGTLPAEVGGYGISIGGGGRW